jgi:hypothetical protein
MVPDKKLNAEADEFQPSKPSAMEEELRNIALLEELYLENIVERELNAELRRAAKMRAYKRAKAMKNARENEAEEPREFTPRNFEHREYKQTRDFEPREYKQHRQYSREFKPRNNRNRGYRSGEFKPKKRMGYKPYNRPAKFMKSKEGEEFVVQQTSSNRN